MELGVPQIRTYFMPQEIRSFTNLRVYQEAFDLQQDVFDISKAWPAEQRYALSHQVRRSSRSVGANISESWAKRKYPPHFVSKLTDADDELQETSHWLATALACEYISYKDYTDLLTRLESIGKGLGKMISMPEKFVPKH
jgi:four helix bundle protein